MRHLILLLLLTLGCATTNYHTNQDLKHETCVLSEEHVRLVTQHFAQVGININMTINHCGPLAPPHSDLGYGIFEAVGLSRAGETKHLLTMLKFAQMQDKWVVLGEPELLADLTQAP
jgi:hypothetical protein